MKFGDDLGADEETALCADFDEAADRVRASRRRSSPSTCSPTRRIPRSCSASTCWRPRATARSSAARSASTTSPLLEQRLEEHKLPREAYEWYLDVRAYGTFPHSGFGMGLERVVAWICGIHHLREAIPYPRTLKRIYP